MTRILITAGGTGGGVYPALVVAKKIREQSPAVELHFAGSAAGMENELVQKSGITFDRHYRLQGGPVHGVNILVKLFSVLRLASGFFLALFFLLWQRPQVVFLTGGWVTLPVALAAWIYRIPVVIFVPDIEPGRTLKLAGRFARVITATVQETEHYYPPGKRVEATGYPLRENLLNAAREEGLREFQLDSEKRTMLVFGGSSGSRAINRAILHHIHDLLAVSDLQILHVSGKLDAQEVQVAYEQLPADIRARYHIYDYIYDFGLALVVADLVISRAGASTLAEFPVAGVPSILIPLAYSWRYQEINADWLVERHAAIRLDEPQMMEQLVPLVHDLLKDTDRLNKMQEAAQAIAHHDGAANIASIILELARK